MAREEQPTESLYDILYADRGRLSSYLAQIDPNGVITGYKTSSTDGSSVGSELGGNVTVAAAKIKHSLSNQDLAERTFDPAAALPVEVMNRLDEQGYIHRDLEAVAVGGLVLVKGRLMLRDFSQFPACWPIIKKALPLQDMAKTANISFAGGGKSISNADVEGFIKSLIDNIPQPVQMTFQSSYEYLWSTLSEDGFVVSPVDIFLKHKSIIPGEWYILGVLDAHPNVDGDEAVPASFGGGMNDPFHTMAQEIRSLFGRPADNYGISPLIIFRKIQNNGN